MKAFLIALFFPAVLVAQDKWRDCCYIFSEFYDENAAMKVLCFEHVALTAGNENLLPLVTNYFEGTGWTTLPDYSSISTIIERDHPVINEFTFGGDTLSYTETVIHFTEGLIDVQRAKISPPKSPDSAPDNLEDYLTKEQEAMFSQGEPVRDRNGNPVFEHFVIDRTGNFLKEIRRSWASNGILHVALCYDNNGQFLFAYPKDVNFDVALIDSVPARTKYKVRTELNGGLPKKTLITLPENRSLVIDYKWTNGRITDIVQYDPDSGKATDDDYKNDFRILFSYDEAGHLKSKQQFKIEKEGDWLMMVYNYDHHSNGKLKSIQKPLDETLNVKLWKEYDEQGRLVVSADDYSKIRTVYDADGQIREQVCTWDDGGSTTLTYRNGKRLKEVGLHSTTTYKVDKRGNVRSQKEATDGKPDNFEIRYTYNEKGDWITAYQVGDYGTPYLHKTRTIIYK